MTFAVSQYNTQLERSIYYNGICETMCYIYKGEITPDNIFKDTIIIKIGILLFQNIFYLNSFLTPLIYFQCSWEKISR